MTATDPLDAAVEAAAQAMHLHVCGPDAEFCNWTEEGDTCPEVDLSDLARAALTAALPAIREGIAAEVLAILVKGENRVYTADETYRMIRAALGEAAK